MLHPVYLVKLFHERPRDVVGDGHHHAGESEQIFHDLSAGVGVEAGGDLVGDDEVVPAKCQPCDADALALPARDTPGTPICIFPHAHNVQCLLHALPYLEPGQSGVHKAKLDILAHGHMREQRVILKHGIDLTALRRDVVHPLPADGYVSLIRGLEARKDSQDGRLAATGRPKEGQKLAVADTQINALKRASVLERFVHTPQFDDIVLSGHSSRLPPYPCMEGRASPNGIATYRPFTAPLVLQCRFLRKSLQRLVRAARQDSRRLSQDLLFHASST